MKRSTIALLFSIVTQTSLAEVCVKNMTPDTDEHFAYEFIKSPVVDRSKLGKPFMVEPKQFIYRPLGIQSEICLEYSDSDNGNYGHLGIFINTTATEMGWFWLTKEPLTTGIDETIELNVYQDKRGKVSIIGLKNGKKMPISVEKISSEKN